VHVHAEGEAAGKRPVEPLAAYAGEHLLQVARIAAVVLVVPEFSDMRELKIGDLEARSDQVFAQEGAHARQVARRGELELVVIIDEAEAHSGLQPGAIAKA